MNSRLLLSLCGSVLSVACASSQSPEHGEHSPENGSAGVAASTALAPLPPDEAGALARLQHSPRHGEWVTITTGSGEGVRAWVVYPERKTSAPVVLVVHEIYGLTPWVRAVADQLAAEGFLAIAPDLLTGKKLSGFPDSVDRQAAVAAMATLQMEDIQRQLNTVVAYALRLPGAGKHYGVVGFCHGGDISFQHAVVSAAGAAIIFYGRAPANTSFVNVRTPVLGLYGGSDSRVDATIPATDSAMNRAGKTYVYHIYEGAGHGFLRQQTGMNGANALAAAKAWPEAVAWFRLYLGK